MSQVKVQGNASGTGQFTIASPNSNTNRTLNLPDADGTIQVSGNAISGTTGTFTGLVDISAASAGQIKFPATQNLSADANTLDDYEEGTYTPNVYHSGSNNSTWAQKQGKYTKIGNQVTVWGVCDAGNSGTAGTAIRIDLPFTMSGYSNVCGGTAVYNGTSATTLGFQMFSGQLYAQFKVPGGDYTNQVSYFGFFVTYTVA